MGQRRDEVLKAAIDLLDDVGLDGITMRLLAGRLGVRASALYRHYPSKQALLDAMVAHLVTPPAGSAPPKGTWDEQLRAVAIGAREIMLAHRDGARLIATFQNPGPDAVAMFHTLVAGLTAEGWSTEKAATAVDTTLAYVNGFTMEEQARKLDNPKDRRDHYFREGLELIIGGVTAELTTG
jgi:TetR/AcrR family transcriptional regulator, tetracycline repressor protein